jgi:NitT/TauT family transport system substrate-binding protein
MPRLLAHSLREALVVAALLTLVTAVGCNNSTANPVAKTTPAEEPEDPTLTPVTLQLNWFPEAEHGGYYAALANGYYKEAGLRVTIVPGGPETPVVQLVSRRSVTFGIANADNILFGRAQQAPIVGLMAPLQISPRCLIVHESSGIHNFDQLKNITIAMSMSNAFSQYLRHKLPLTGVKIVPYSGNVAQFLLDKKYAQQGYVFSEPFVARKEGGDPRVLMLSEIGFNPYTSVLICHDDQVEEHAELVHKMVKASIRGWQAYVNDPEKANALIHAKNPEMDLDILEFGAKTLTPLVLDEASEQEGIGTMSRARWQKLADQLVESKQLKPSEVDVKGAYTTKFIRDRK